MRNILYSFIFKKPLGFFKMQSVQMVKSVCFIDKFQSQKSVNISL